MTQQEQARLQVLNNLLAGYMTTEQAATLMGVSTRHTRRILAAYRQEGAAALAHGNRGRRPANATPKMTSTGIVHLARTRYAGVNHTHLSELLSEREGIEIGRSTLRRILVSAGVNSPRQPRPPKHRVRRQRMPREGMLIQIDGSHHRWLGEDGLQFTLLLAVDDATGCVASALFCQEETTRDYFQMLEGLIRRWGIPLALYADRHTVFKQTPGTRQKVRAATQFTRAMDELGIQLVFARSPQGKGRVERMEGTFQDRLISELRLAGASTIPEAKRVLADFLPRFNERFRVPTQQPGAAYRPLDPDICLDRIFCYKHWRRVARDNTVKYRWRTLQLLPDVDPGGVTPDRRWRCWRDWMEPFGCNTRGASSRRRRLRPVRESCVTPLRCPLETFIPTMRTVGGCTSMRRSRQAQRLMVSTEHVRASLCCAGSPIGDRGRGGRRYIEPSFRACPTGQSQGTWV